MSPRKDRPAKPGREPSGRSEGSAHVVPGFAPEPAEPVDAEPQGELPVSGLERTLGILVLLGAAAMLAGLCITLFGSWSGAIADPTWPYLLLLAGAIVTIGCVLALQSLRTRDRARRRTRGVDAR